MTCESAGRWNPNCLVETPHRYSMHRTVPAVVEDKWQSEVFEQSEEMDWFVLWVCLFFF